MKLIYLYSFALIATENITFTAGNIICVIAWATTDD